MTDEGVRAHPQRFVAGGEAIGRDHDGRVLFIRGGIPGEEVSVVALESKRDWSRVEVREVHVASADRVLPPCHRRLEGCGGCDWQHIDPAAQLPAKVEIVKDAFHRTAKLDDAAIRIGEAVPDRGYRTTIRVVGDEDGRPSYRRERSHETVSAQGCLIAHPILESVLGSIRLSPDLEATLRVSAASAEMTAQWDVRRGEVAGLPEAVKVGPDARIEEIVDGHRLRISTGSFFQSGPAAAQVLVESVRRVAPELEHPTTVVDAYGGVGLFAVTATARDSQIHVIEKSRSAISDCKKNLANRTVTLHRSRVEDWSPGRLGDVGVVIADPSRSGLGKRAVPALAATGAPVIVLVSCDPVALARDTVLLAGHGYRHHVSEVHDLFPHTHHVECVTRFQRI